MPRPNTPGPHVLYRSSRINGQKEMIPIVNGDECGCLTVRGQGE
jgi:hypothetical protein